jgi:hypothetical protein
MPSRFDASMLGSAIISAAKDGVDRFGNPSLTNLGTGGAPTSGSGITSPSGTSSPAPSGSMLQPGNVPSSEGTAGVNLNENLKNIGKFFRRDLGGFGGRFGRSTEEGA